METFTDLYPFRTFTWGTKDFADGVRRVPLPEALTDLPHLRTNPMSKTSLLVLDIDKDDAWRSIQSSAYDDGLPEPNWVTVNPQTSHAHAGFFIKEPVTMTPRGRAHPQEYLDAVYRSLGGEYGADPRYHNVFLRNPLYSGHEGIFIREEPYTLGQLHEGVGTLAKVSAVRPAIEDEVAVGRNVSLFHSMRKVGYRRFSAHSSLESFRDEVLMLACIENSMFSEPLYPKEVERIVDSLTAWTWKRRETLARDFSAKQASRSVQGHLARWGDNAQRDENIRQMTAEGFSRVVIADTLGCSQATVSRIRRTL